MQTRGQKKSWDCSHFRQEQWVKAGIVFNSLCTVFLLKFEIFFGSMTFWPRGHSVMFKHFHTDHWSKMKTNVRCNKRKQLSPGNRMKTCNACCPCRCLYLLYVQVPSYFSPIPVDFIKYMGLWKNYLHLQYNYDYYPEVRLNAINITLRKQFVY